MKIKGFIEYNNSASFKKITVDFDTEKDCSQTGTDVFDAIAYALYGKTIYNEIVRIEMGVPFIALNIECNSKAFYVARQPEYLRNTAPGTTYLTKELFSIKTESAEYDALSEEKYYEILKEYLDISFNEFVSFLKP